MKKIICVALMLLNVMSNLYSQQGEWTWMNGTSVTASAGVYGTQGVPSPAVTPPAMYEGAQWTDTSGVFWLYGGQSIFGINFYSDMWKFDPTTNQWTWVKGPGGALAQAPVYGTKGVAAPNNSPGGRGWAPGTWTDDNNHLWMFAGANYQVGDINDFWMYDIPTNQWTWVGGSTTPGASGTFGVQGVPSINNIPGARHESACTWKGNNNTLWLFGGYRNVGEGNDLWRYDIATNEWTWMNGSALYDLPPNWGVKYFPVSTNDPGGRNCFARWTDPSYNLYMCGGLKNNGANECYNDVWNYDLNTNLWTWIGGDSVGFSNGLYKSNCAPDFNKLLRARFENRSSWQDACHNLWTFGGSAMVSSGAMNDLWHFNTSNYEWTYINGDTTTFTTFFYGTKTVSSLTNKPPAKIGAMSWLDKQNNLWMFGGTNSNFNHRNDMWRFVIDTNCIQTKIDCNQPPLNAPPVVAFYSSDTILCEKSAIDFFDSSTGNPNMWHWYFPGASPDTSTLQNPVGIYFPSYGTYPVTLVAYNSFGQDSLTITSFITVVANPPKPIVTFNGSQICCSQAQSYQWYFNNAPITIGGTSACYTPSLLGNYYVIITDSNGCSSPSDVFIVNGINDNALNYLGYTLSPNPANNILYITNSKHNMANVTITIYDASLRTIKEVNTNNAFNQKQIIVPCDELSDGIYFIRINEQKHFGVEKLIVKH
jgi:PKD repeat protein